MTSSPPNTSPSRALPPTRRALAAINYNSLIADHAISSSEGEDEDDESSQRHLHEDEVRPAIGVSIGRQQSYLTSPTTPAVDKAAALHAAGGFFRGDELDGAGEHDQDHEDEDETSPTGERRAPIATGITTVAAPPQASDPLPSPWRAEQAWEPRQQRTSTTASPPADSSASSPNRSRPSSQPGSKRASWQSTFFAKLPLRPRRRSLTGPSPASASSSSTGTTTPNTNTAATATTFTGFGDESTSWTTTTSPTSVGRPAPLTRVDTELSHVSSLGDDSRFEHVSAQVNSRVKALKDSLQDSRIRMPSISSISLTSLAPDFLTRDRSGSLGGSNSPARRASSPIASPDSDGAAMKHHHGHHHDPKPIDPLTRQPYSSAKAALHDTLPDHPHTKSTSHPHFTRALANLTGDVVILGGYRGSVLRSAHPPHRQLWVPLKVGLNLRKVNLELPLSDDADARATETVIPDGMLKRIGPVDISRRLFKRLRSCENSKSGKLRVHDYGYDWRLHPAHLSAQLQDFLASLPCNRPGVPKGQRGATVIAHSLGGLITRHAVNSRPELFAGVLYAGVPTTCINILGPLRNGDEVMLSDKVLTAQVNFTIRTSFALLPLDGKCFVDADTGEEIPMDFFDARTWVEGRLSPVVGRRPLPPLLRDEKGSAAAAAKDGKDGKDGKESGGGVLEVLKSGLAKLKPGGGGGAHHTTLAADPSKAAVAAGGVVAEPEMGENTAGSSGAAVATGNISREEEGDEEESNASTSTEGPVTTPDTEPDNSTALTALDTKEDALASDPDPSPSSSSSSSPHTAVTLPRAASLAYLTRTLASIKTFKEALAFDPSHAAANAYPPHAVIYGKSTPTVARARIRGGRDGIRRADAYDHLAFASGDGVVLARAAMLPEGYKVAKGGVVSSERGHVTLLGDLEAVGRAVNALIRERGRGIGLGVGDRVGKEE